MDQIFFIELRTRNDIYFQCSLITVFMPKLFPPVIGEWAPDEVAKKLQEIGGAASPEKIQVKRGTVSTLGWLGGERKPWQHTAHVFGFIPTSDSASSQPVNIMPAGQIKADTSLMNKSIVITLDRLRVFEYPGGGMHQILFDFNAQNQVQGSTEDLHFNQTYRVQEGEQAGIIGYPVFIGLNVGSQGVGFRCYTVNVKNEDDEKILGILDSDVFKNGLKLAESINPVIPVVSGFATGLTKMIASRNRNIPVQEFYMGLNFTGIQTRARLAQGSYIAVQVPSAEQWDWSKWVFDPRSEQIVSTNPQGNAIPYNYIVFSVSKFD